MKKLAVASSFINCFDRLVVRGADPAVRTIESSSISIFAAEDK